MRAPSATQNSIAIGGEWKIYAHAPGLAPVDVTFVRGVPTQIGDWELGDPFGPVSCSVSFPKITYFDQIGMGDLYWLVPYVNIDVVFVGALPASYPGGKFRIECMASSFEYGDDGTLSVPLIGAFFQMDNYLAKPEYSPKPYPYEKAIARCWHNRPDLRLAQMKIEFPAWWTTIYAPVAKAPSYLVPIGLTAGDKWSGLLTRETGSWDPVLTSYIQTLLSSMYTQRGRWTIDLDVYRRPVMRHRDLAVEVNSRTIKVDPLGLGTKIILSADWSQTANVIFGQGTALSGEVYSGQQVSADGLRTTYRPLAALRQVHPANDDNTWLDTARVRKETLLQLQEGLVEADARTVAQAHLVHFAEPGLTGTIELATDPVIVSTSEVLSRFVLQAGMNALVPNIYGHTEGIILHIAKVNTNLEAGTVSLTVDSKFRDRLTVDEVRLRGRDSLSISRGLIGGQYAPPIPDQLLPWSYAEGSGYIPSGPEYSSLRLFDGMPDTITFPWQEWTSTRPPKDAAYKNCYIRVRAKNVNADENWSFRHDREGTRLGIPIKLSQAGTIRMVQIAAYDKDGLVMKVPFHFSLYTSKGVNLLSMPRIPVEHSPINGYLAGQHYPFFPTAWETYKTDGTKQATDITVASQVSGFIRAYGTGLVKAGYWPGSSLDGDLATGQLVDEGNFQYNLSDAEQGSQIDPFSGEFGYEPGHIYAMIYCDGQAANEVFFAGRMFRVEPTGGQ